MLKTSRLEEGRQWGSSALLRQRAALNEANVEVDHVCIRGTSIRVGRRQGHGPPLLICNGIGANFEVLLPFVRAFHGRRILLFDIPGIGGSGELATLPLMRTYSYFARRVLDHYGEQTAHVAGISWGGLLAQRLAFDAPSRVLSLILMATSSGITMIPGRLGALRMMLTPRRYLSRSFMVQNAHTLYGRELLAGHEQAIDYAQMTRAPSFRSYLQQLGAALLFTSLPWLWRLQCRTLVMVGDDDPLMRVANAQVLARCMPRAKLQIIGGAGHLFAVMQAERTAASVEEFLLSA